MVEYWQPNLQQKQGSFRFAKKQVPFSVATENEELMQVFSETLVNGNKTKTQEEGENSEYMERSTVTPTHRHHGVATSRSSGWIK